MQRANIAFYTIKEVELIHDMYRLGPFSLKKDNANLL